MLVFYHPDSTSTAYETEADCCSDTWFADIVGVNCLIGQVVLQVENIELDCPQDDRRRQEWDSFYGVKLTTSKGYVDIVYRNSSNGYYCGNIVLCESFSPLTALVEITDDWSA